MSAVKRIFCYLVGTEDLGLWYPKGQELKILGYYDADFSRCRVERKSTRGSCVFIGGCLISWNSKKQNSIALSTIEAEYTASVFCVAQILWIKNQLDDYSINLTQIPILCDNNSVINLAKNPIVHSRTKHIEVKHHCIRDHMTKGDIELKFVDTSNQIANVFIEPLVGEDFTVLFRELGMLRGRDLDADHTPN